MFQVLKKLCSENNISMASSTLSPKLNSSISTLSKLKLRIGSLTKFLLLPTKVCIEVHKQLKRYWTLQSPWELLKSKGDSDNDNHDPLSVASTQQRILVQSSIVIQLTDIKRIAQGTGTSVTAVLLSTFSSGLTSFFYSDSNYKNGQRPGRNVVKQMLWMLPAPAQNHPEGLINSTYGSAISLPLEPAMGFLERLKCTQAQLENVPFIELQMSYFGMSLLGLLPKSLHNLLSISRKLPPCTIISNFPGPLEPITLNGKEVTDMTYTMVAAASGLFICVLSYAGRLTFYTSADHFIFHSAEIVENLVAHIEQEFTRLQNMNMIEVEGRRIVSSVTMPTENYLNSSTNIEIDGIINSELV